MDLGEIPTPELPEEAPPAPPNSASPQDLGTHPGLAQLLQSLGGLLGGEGLSPPLHQQLREAEASLGRARGLWLPLELLWRILGEMIRDPQNVEPKVLQGLEQELSWARLRRGAQKLQGLVPGPEPPQLLPRLLPELQRRLRDKREELQNFLQGSPGPGHSHPSTSSSTSPTLGHPKLPAETQTHPKVAPNAPSLGQLLRGLRLRLLRERLRERRVRDRLEGMRWKYPEVLSRCLSLLAQLCSLRQLQAHLDEGRGRYLQAKGGATLLKSRLEELRVLLDTYPAPTVEAHRRIRALLSESRRAAEAEAAILGAELGALRGLGPEFRQLALELGEIRQETARKRWALSQLRPPAP